VALIDRETFVELVRQKPTFSLYVMRQLATRIRRMNKSL
jgi:CRP-like cAMP-binding protein